MNQHDGGIHGNGSTVRYGQWVVRWRFVIVPVALLIALAIASGARFLGFDTNYRVFFSKDNPQLLAFDALENIYNKNDNIIFALEPADGDAFSPKMLHLVAELTDEAWKIPYSRRVDSITNFQHSRGVGDDLIVEDLVDVSGDLSPEKLSRTKEVALDEPLLRNRLVTDQANVVAVNAILELSGENPREVSEAVAYARNIAEGIREKNPEVTVYLSGTVMLNNAFSEGGENDMKTLMPIMFLVMIVIMIVLLRSVYGTLATLGVIVLSTATAMGIAGFLGIKITPPSSIAPTMIMTLAVADSVHILVSMMAAMRGGMKKFDAVVESLRVNMLPVFLTSLTTAIGFLSLNFSDSPPFRDLGNISGIGVVAAFVFSILFLPALVAILPMRVKQVAGSGSGWGMERFSTYVIQNQRVIRWGSLGILVLIMAFIPRNQFNDQFVNYFDERVAFRTDTDFIMDNLTGIYTVDYSLEGGESGGISEPAFLAKMDEFAEWFRKQPGVLQVNSISHTMKRLNRNMHGEDPAEFKLPDTRELAAQYLLLYEMSLPYGLDLNNQINVDKSSTRLSVTLANMSSNELRATAQSGEKWLRENAPPSMFSYGIGPSVMFSYISERNTKSMVRGLLVALGLISVTLMFALRSLRFGMLSLIPNLIPIALAFGIWGMLIAEIGIGLSTVVTMSLGIVVDDTVHFLSKYLRARRERNLNAEEAVHYAFNSVGKALIITSAILVAGFIVMTRSTFAMNSVMGWFTSMAIALALVADFFLLPTMLIRMDGSGNEKSEPAPAIKKDALAGA